VSVGSHKFQAKPARFGIPDYQGTLIDSSLVLPSTNTDGCGEFSQRERGSWPSGKPIIIVVDRGTCFFVDKLRNIQASGASGMIVVNNEGGDPITMAAPDAHDHSTTVIPSVMISSHDGQQLKSIIRGQPTATFGGIEWNLPRTDGKVEMILFTSMIDGDDYSFKKNFREIAHELQKQNKLIFRPVYWVQNGTHWGCDTTGLPCSTQCTNGGRYCEEDPDGQLFSGVEGFHVVEENLRQMCVWDFAVAESEDVWWEYTSRFDEMCLQEDAFRRDLEDCAFEVMDIVNRQLQGFVKNCISTSGGYGMDQNSKNAKYEEAIREREQDHEIYMQPGLTINGFEVGGSFHCPEPVNADTCHPFKAFCQGFDNENDIPALCSNDKGCGAGQKRNNCGVCMDDPNDQSSCDPNYRTTSYAPENTKNIVTERPHCRDYEVTEIMKMLTALAMSSSTGREAMWGCKSLAMGIVRPDLGDVCQCVNALKSAGLDISTMNCVILEFGASSSDVTQLCSGGAGGIPTLKPTDGDNGKDPLCQCLVDSESNACHKAAFMHHTEFPCQDFDNPDCFNKINQYIYKMCFGSSDEPTNDSDPICSCIEDNTSPACAVGYEYHIAKRDLPCYDLNDRQCYDKMGVFVMNVCSPFGPGSSGSGSGTGSGSSGSGSSGSSGMDSACSVDDGKKFMRMFLGAMTNQEGIELCGELSFNILDLDKLCPCLLKVEELAQGVSLSDFNCKTSHLPIEVGNIATMLAKCQAPEEDKRRVEEGPEAGPGLTMILLIILIVLVLIGIGFGAFIYWRQKKAERQIAVSQEALNVQDTPYSNLEA